MIYTVLIISVVLLICILIYISNNCLKVKKYVVENKKIPDAFDGFKIVHISDVHSKIFGKNNIKVIQKVNEINPDIIIMSGDIIDKRERDMDKFINMYKDIYTKYPVFYSIGNHERKLGYIRYKQYINKLKDLGVHVIINGKEYFNKKDDKIVINALKFRENMQPKKLTLDRKNKYITYMIKKLSSLDSTKFNILIAHDPENFKLYKELGVDLIFSGHIHGGLIRFGKICLLSPRRKFFPKYSYGKTQEDNVTIITSSGMGNASIPIRMFNRPEIVQVTLKKEKIS